MPAALEVDHDKVRTVAMVVGVREAARQFDLSEEVVCKWSQREGWFKHKQDADNAVLVKQESQGLSASVRKSGSEALKGVGERSRYRAAKIGDRTLQAISKRKDMELIALAQPFATTVGALSKIHQWDQPSQTNVQVNVNLTGQRFPDSPK